MNNQNVGSSNKKGANNNRLVLIGVVGLIIVIILLFILFGGSKKGNGEKQKINVSNIVEKAETKVIFVESSDSKKCKNCSAIKNALSKKNVNFIIYNVENYSEKEYSEDLKKMEINPDDFGYPAIIYMKDGRLFANQINIEDTKVVDSFVDSYELNKVK